MLARRLVPATFQFSNGALVDLCDVKKSRDTLHDFAQAAVSLTVLRDHLPVLRGQEFYSLRECFVPLGQTLNPFVYGHA